MEFPELHIILSSHMSVETIDEPAAINSDMMKSSSLSTLAMMYDSDSDNENILTQ